MAKKTKKKVKHKVKKTRKNSNTGRGKGYKFGVARKHLIKCLKAGSTITAACSNSRISRDLFYHYKELLPDFAKEVLQAMSVRDEVVVDALYYNAAKRKDVGAQRFWLTNRMSKKWKNLNHEKVDVKQPVTIIYEDAPGPKKKKSKKGKK